MPNIQGDYSLTEVATKLNVSSSWINDVQRKTDICKKESTQGKRAEFTDKDLIMLESVKMLRQLDYSLNDIKHIYNLENKLITLGGLFPYFVIDKKTSDGIVMIINQWVVINNYVENDGIINPLKNRSDDEKKEYTKLFEEYVRICFEITRRLRGLQEKTQVLNNMMATNYEIGLEIFGDI
jgi:DNA-binding transcriptional MerR regulator